MAMPQDLAGRYIEYRINMGGAVGGATNDHGQVMTTQTIPAVVNVYNAGLVRTGPKFAQTAPAVPSRVGRPPLNR